MVADLGDFVNLVDVTSPQPNYTESLKCLIMENMEENDWLEVVTFFTNLQAGYESFPNMGQLIHMVG